MWPFTRKVAAQPVEIQVEGPCHDENRRRQVQDAVIGGEEQINRAITQLAMAIDNLTNLREAVVKEQLFGEDYLNEIDALAVEVTNRIKNELLAGE